MIVVDQTASRSSKLPQRTTGGEDFARYTLPPDHGPAPTQPPEPAPVFEEPVAQPPRNAGQFEAYANPPGVFSTSRRPSSYAGAWKANAGGISCRVQLSSVPSLDLYKASSQGCQITRLQGVNGWTLRDNQVILFSHGQVIARLAGAEASLEGVLTDSDAALTMSR